MPNKRSQLALLALAETLAMGPWFAASAVLPQLRAEWTLDSGLASWLTMSVQLGFVAGMLTVLLGVGGGFILVPAMIYILGMAPRVVVGTSLVMILAVSAVSTMIHATTTQAVDIVLAGLLLIGGVVGAQYGAILTTRLKPDLLRLALAGIILAVALRMLLGLTWRPDEIFSIEYL